MSTTLTVHQALAAVMAELPAIGKTDQAPEGYAYRGIEAITKQLQPLLAKHGVVIVPSGTIVEQRPSPAMKDGWTDTLLAVDWLICGPDGTTIPARTNGIGRDRSDKGGNKAATQAFKVLLLQLFCVADKADDSDGLTYEQDRVEHRFTKAAAKKVAVREFRIKGLDEQAAKSEAAEMWTAYSMDGLELSEQLVVEKVSAWLSAAEPFTEPSGEGEAAEADSPAAAQNHGGPVAPPSPDVEVPA